MSCDGIDRERTRGEGMHYLVVSLCEIVFFLSSFCILIVKRTASSEWCAVARGKLLGKTTAVFSSPFHYLSLSLFLSGIRLNSNLFGLLHYTKCSRCGFSWNVSNARERSAWNTTLSNVIFFLHA